MVRRLSGFVRLNNTISVMAHLPVVGLPYDAMLTLIKFTTIQLCRKILRSMVDIEIVSTSFPHLTVGAAAPGMCIVVEIVHPGIEVLAHNRRKGVVSVKFVPRDFNWSVSLRRPDFSSFRVSTQIPCQ